MPQKDLPNFKKIIKILYIYIMNFLPHLDPNFSFGKKIKLIYVNI